MCVPAIGVAGTILFESLTEMSVINVQESFLNVAVAAGKPITVHLLNGAKLSGSVRSFDKYSIVIETNTQEQLIFKHSVSALLLCCKNKRCNHGAQSKAQFS